MIRREETVTNTVWNKDPDDGVCCLVGTRRVLDEYGFCCDYNRCQIYRVEADGNVMDRCMLDQGHSGSCHGERACYWRYNYYGKIPLAQRKIVLGVPKFVS